MTTEPEIQLTHLPMDIMAAILKGPIDNNPALV